MGFENIQQAFQQGAQQLAQSTAMGAPQGQAQLQSGTAIREQGMQNQARAGESAIQAQGAILQYYSQMSRLMVDSAFEGIKMAYLKKKDAKADADANQAIRDVFAAAKEARGGQVWDEGWGQDLSQDRGSSSSLDLSQYDY